MGSEKLLPSLCLILLLILSTASAANILVWQAVGTHSTRISMWPLMEALVEKGHNVTFLSAFENMDKSKTKINYIVPKKWKEAVGGNWEKDVSYFDERKNSNAFTVAKVFFDFMEHGVTACEMLYSDPEFKAWVTSPDTKFDLVIAEYVFNECAYGLAHYWNAKLASYGTSDVLPHMTEALGIPDESSHVGTMLFSLPPSTKKTPLQFWERFLNGVGPLIYHFWRNWSYFPRLEEITRKGLGLREDQLPQFKDIEKNTTVTFLTTHYSFGAARSLPPNVIPIAGAVVSKKLKPMPKDMIDFINSGNDGFIYISFGTFVSFVNFDDEVQKEFIAALRAFPDMRFVWKSSEEIKYELPKNVFITKWAPQQTILAHPKIKAFISHSGMGGSFEAIHNAVPLISIPVMGDQNQNAALIVERDAGVQIEVTTLTKEELEWGIKEVLNNPKYRDGMNRLSTLFKDRPSPPIEEACFWVEYVLRHDNIHEILMPASVHQPWWKRKQLDVWFTAGSLVLVIMMAPLILLKGILKRVLKTEKVKQS